MSENLGASGVEDSSWRRSNLPTVDVGITVRKWNVYFFGVRGQSIEAFLDKIEACRGSTSLSEAKVFQALPKLLKGVAAMWFQVKKHRWNTWSEFCSAARRCYGTGRGYQQRLLAEDTARAQWKDELARDFIICLLVIIRKMEPIPNLEMQLDMLHRNLRTPKLQKLMRRAGFHDIDKLQEMACHTWSGEAIQTTTASRVNNVARGGLQVTNGKAGETKIIRSRTCETWESRRHGNFNGQVDLGGYLGARNRIEPVKS